MNNAGGVRGREQVGEIINDDIDVMYVASTRPLHLALTPCRFDLNVVVCKLPVARGAIALTQGTGPDPLDSARRQADEKSVERTHHQHRVRFDR